MTDEEFIKVQKLLRELMVDARLVMLDNRFVKLENHDHNLGMTPELALAWAMARKLDRAGHLDMAFEEFILLVEEVQGGKEQALLSMLTDEDQLDEFLETSSVTVELRSRKFELSIRVLEVTNRKI